MRAKYGPVSKYGMRVPDFYDQPPLPDEPTSAQPGSEAKMSVMRARIEAGWHLHRPMDFKGG